MRKLALAVIILSFVFACAGPAFAVQNWIIQEVTFDDAGDGTGGLIKSLEMRATDSTHSWHMNFRGNATRTNLSGGKYGRGAQFDGTSGSFIEITELNRPNGPQNPSNANFRFLLWIKPTPPQGYQERQEIFRASNSFAVELKNGEIKIRDEDPSDPHVYSTGLFPSTGAFHHLWVEYENPTMRVHVDFGSPFEVEFGPMAPWDPDGQPPTTGSMGSGFFGVLDELLVTEFNGVPPDELRFDRNSFNCPSGLACAESSFNMFPQDWPPPPLPGLEVPVRYKAVYKSTGGEACTSNHRCPLLMIVSGGGACGDDYSYLEEVQAYAQRGFFVVTVDPNCEYGYPWRQFPHETSQLIEAQEHVRDLSKNPLANRIQTGDYYATGCSHGAQAVALLLMSEPVGQPKRVVARSANYAAHCTYHMQIWKEGSGQQPGDEAQACIGAQRSLDRVTCGDCDAPSPHDHNTDQEECIEEQWGVIDKVNVTSVQDRHLGAIWGGPQFYPPRQCDCPVTGGPPPGGCTESIEGNDLGGRLMHKYWREKEDENPPATPRTGWFWEWTNPGLPNNNGFCKHCPWDGVTGEIARCSACFLKYGYDLMKTTAGCTDCDDVEDDVPQPIAACPVQWGMPEGGSNPPCTEQGPGAPGPCLP